jgi:cell division transport system ATP-binding protein
MHEETPSRGTIIVNGTNVSTLKRKKVPYLRRNMGIVFQDFRLIDKMTVYDNVAFAMRAIGARPSAVKKRVPYILNLVGLSHKAQNRPSELSGGEQQRVSLARALVNNPSIIIADEPTGNIDPEMSYEIIGLLSEINAQGTTILVVTHEHQLVRRFNKRVIEIEKGKVISDTKEPVITDEEVEFDDSKFELDPLPDDLAEAIEQAERAVEETPEEEPSQSAPETTEETEEAVSDESEDKEAQQCE